MVVRGRIALVALLVAGVISVPVLGAAAAGSRPALRAGARTTLGTGVTMWREHFRTRRGQGEQAVLVQVHLGKHVTLQARTPNGLIGGQRAPLSTMANSVGAVAGINADFFDLWSDTAIPRGAVINRGRLIKSPRPDRLSNLFLRPDGRAAIGAIDFAGSFTRLAASRRPALTHRIYSTNTLDDALNGRVTYLTPADVGGELDDGCVVVRVKTVAGVSTVTSVAHRSAIHRQGTGRSALVGCWNAADWLAQHLRAGDHLHVALSFPKGKPGAAVTGRRVLVRSGKAYDDPTGAPLSTRGPNPESFACVSRDGLTVLLGVIDGRLYGSVGVTYGQLTDYMLQLKCWNGLVLDGGGSSEMVAKVPGRSGVAVLNHPSDGAERRIADGLVVVVH